MTKNGNQQTTNAPVIMANVLAAFLSRLDSMLRRRLQPPAAVTAATATDVILRVNLAGCCCCGATANVCSTYKLSAVSDGKTLGRPRLKTPTAAAMTEQEEGSTVETNEIPVLLLVPVVEFVGAADETAPLKLSLNPPMAAAAADDDEIPLFCLCSLRLLILFLAVRKILQ